MTVLCTGDLTEEGVDAEGTKAIVRSNSKSVGGAARDPSRSQRPEKTVKEDKVGQGGQTLYKLLQIDSAGCFGYNYCF